MKADQYFCNHCQQYFEIKKAEFDKVQAENLKCPHCGSHNTKWFGFRLIGSIK